jgi:hypothetical protein
MKNILYIITDNSGFLCPKWLWKGNVYKTGKYEQAIDAYGRKQTSILQSCILTLGTEL